MTVMTEQAVYAVAGGAELRLRIQALEPEVKLLVRTVKR